ARVLKDRYDMDQTAALQAPPVEDTVGDYVHNTIAGSLTAANTQESAHNISTSITPALQAAETGATSNASDEGMLETRHVINTNSVSEMSVESFYGRSGLVTITTLNAGDTRTVWGINFNEFVQLRAKFNLFTYTRFDAEFTLLATLIKGGTAATHSVQLQVMYLPPGAIEPSDQDTYQWQTAANASVFFSTNGVPARFSVPYVGTASAYSQFYDGYNNFGSERAFADYGRIGSNDMGKIALRAVAPLAEGEIVKMRIYVKPKHVRVWGPRAPRISPYQYKFENAFSNQDRMVPDRASITTTGAFGQQSGAIYVGNYKV
ncbi:VP1 protein, partial [Enterovirus G]